jgi:hypothetical protein
LTQPLNFASNSGTASPQGGDLVLYRSVFCAAILLFSSLTYAQEPGVTLIEPAPATVPGEAVFQRSPFRKAMVKAIRTAVRDKEITPAQAIKLRVALHSPAFEQHAKTLCVVQIASSGIESEFVPITDGKIAVASINWEALGEFLKVVIPLLLELLVSLGVA